MLHQELFPRWRYSKIFVGNHKHCYLRVFSARIGGDLDGISSSYLASENWSPKLPSALVAWWLSWQKHRLVMDGWTDRRTLGHISWAYTALALSVVR